MKKKKPSIVLYLEDSEVEKLQQAAQKTRRRLSNYCSWAALNNARGVLGESDAVQ